MKFRAVFWRSKTGANTDIFRAKRQKIELPKVELCAVCGDNSTGHAGSADQLSLYVQDLCGGEVVTEHVVVLKGPYDFLIPGDLN